MKVNIGGHGSIPGLNAIAPVFGKDLSETEIIRIINRPNLKVYDTETGGLITKATVDSYLKKGPAGLARTKKERVFDLINKAKSVDIPVEEVTEPPSTPEEVETAPEEVETSVPEVDTEPTDEVETVEEDEVKEEKPKQNNNTSALNQINNKNKHNKNKH